MHSIFLLLLIAIPILDFIRKDLLRPDQLDFSLQAHPHGIFFQIKTKISPKKEKNLKSLLEAKIWFMLSFKNCNKFCLRLQMGLLGLTLQFRKTHRFAWFKMSCFSCSVFSCVYCFLLKMMKLYKEICTAWISRTSVRKRTS